MPQLVDPWGPSIRSLRDLGTTMDTMYDRRKADEETAYERERQRMLDQGNLATLGLQQERMRFGLDEDRKEAQQIQSLRDLQGEISQGVPQAGPTLSGEPLPNRPLSGREKAERYQEFANKFMLNDPTKFSDITDQFDAAEQKKHTAVLDAVKTGGLEYGKRRAAELGIDPSLLDSMDLTPDDVMIMEIPRTGHTLIRTPDGKYLIDKPDVNKGAGGGGDSGYLEVARQNAYNKSPEGQAAIFAAREAARMQGRTAAQAGSEAIDAGYAIAKLDDLEDFVSANRDRAFGSINKMQQALVNIAPQWFQTTDSAARAQLEAQVADVIDPELKKMFGPPFSDTDMRIMFGLTGADLQNPETLLAAIRKAKRAQSNLISKARDREAMLPAGAGVKTAPPDRRVPNVGDIVKGYRFKGGNPADKANWEKQ